MLGRIISMVAGRSIARTVGGAASGPAGAVIGVLLPTVLRRMGPQGMIVIEDILDRAQDGDAQGDHAHSRQLIRRVPRPDTCDFRFAATGAMVRMFGARGVKPPRPTLLSPVVCRS